MKSKRKTSSCEQGLVAEVMADIDLGLYSDCEDSGGRSTTT